MRLHQGASQPAGTPVPTTTKVSLESPPRNQAGSYNPGGISLPALIAGATPRSQAGYNLILGEKPPPTLEPPLGTGLATTLGTPCTRNENRGYLSKRLIFVTALCRSLWWRRNSAVLKYCFAALSAFAHLLTAILPCSCPTLETRSLIFFFAFFAISYFFSYSSIVCAVIGEKWLRLFEQLSPIYKWTAGGFGGAELSTAAGVG